MRNDVFRRGRWLDVFGQVQHKRSCQVASRRVSAHDHIPGIHWDMMSRRVLPILHHERLMVRFGQVQERRKRVYC